MIMVYRILVLFTQNTGTMFCDPTTKKKGYDDPGGVSSYSNCKPHSNNLKATLMKVSEKIDNFIVEFIYSLQFTNVW